VGQAYLPHGFPPLTASKSLRETDLEGKVVLVNFWGYWCPPCRSEFPHMMELEKSLRENPDFRFVSVASSGNPDSDEDAPEFKDRTVAFLSEQRANPATYIDPQAREQRRIAALTGDEILGYPLTAVIDRRGIIRGLWPGFQRGDELAMRAVIDEALAAK
jgi:thiol-disulfide isomerase/thioredoxin